MNISLGIKFGIGFFAGLCAALFPRVFAELATAGDSEAVKLFSLNYLLLSLLFAALIGVVIAILEWESKGSPKDTFMSALAIPGLLSGALNTAVSVKGLEQVEKEKNLYEQTLQQDFQIPTLEPSALVPITHAKPVGSPRLAPGFIFIGNAYAGDGGFRPVSDYGFGVRRNRSEYVVVVGRANDRKSALAKARDLRGKIPVNVFRDSSGRYVITTASGAQSKAQALIEAVKLKKTKGLATSLMKIE